MELFPLLSLTIVTAAVLSWVNRRWVKLPTTIGVMLIALAMSAGLIVGDVLGFGIRELITDLLERIDFGHVLLDVMLAFLLFAGALHIDLGELLDQKSVVGLLATVGVAFSTGVVGWLISLLTGLLGLEVSLLQCLLFGALIAPTDPIAVLGIFRAADAPRSLELKVAGESLFNDGIGVVVFTALLAVADAGAGHGGELAGGPWPFLLLFLQEVPGSLVLGLAGGYLAYRMLRGIDDYHVEVLVTLALAMGIYSLSTALHSSGPLAVVVAGLLVGNRGRALAMSPKTEEHIDTFWELVDEILNVLLFVLLGMEVLVIELDPAYLLAGALAIPLVLLARFASVGLTVAALRRVRGFTPGATRIITWAGLRGGISVALALSLPAELHARDLLLTMTYVVVVFSIVVQGLTIGPLVRRLTRPATAHCDSE